MMGFLIELDATGSKNSTLLPVATGRDGSEDILDILTNDPRKALCYVCLTHGLIGEIEAQVHIMEDDLLIINPMKYNFLNA
ncbi:Hypothetical predicted protein [Olea europaea subsp. europaea]|uniref:Uncharacterized protein n=1 Tax=Olea europaea subsp. europaea TaxID=158383 RepID=A0A8S0TQC3_OLEEU|nr:Hypothetical predicted protein [Olea europaea subsp. europaea]